ncbi:Methyltransferase type 11 [Caenispirillum salinarum AK4]|uniref:Methyltransferase type 11 n=1 Tax=Caenispirillum salinarum AK4 TaxID=1238182 RepID=K9GSS0_9PROT|nr:TIGR04290 family methyltransferase [Caenispirillum salinarum]EKV28187.1 Methyltransferase type 11 [Caenispirillum salinarum AK4]
MTHGAHPTGPSAEDLAPWFHNLHLPDGSQTRPDHPLGDFPRYKWEQVAEHIPADLAGKRCLDIGCNAGFYSFELAKRGAEVVGIDINDHYLRQARWAAARMELSERVTFRKRHVYDFARGATDNFDIVIFMGVLYHLRYPMLALDTIRHLDPELMVFQTLMTADRAVAGDAAGDVHFEDRETLDQPGWPRMAFIENSLNRDPTNWWVPNHAAILGMMRATGFRVVARPGDEIYICRPMAIRTGHWLADEFDAATGRADKSDEVGEP